MNEFCRKVNARRLLIQCYLISERWSARISNLIEMRQTIVVSQRQITEYSLPSGCCARDGVCLQSPNIIQIHFSISSSIRNSISSQLLFRLGCRTPIHIIVVYCVHFEWKWFLCRISMKVKFVHCHFRLTITLTSAWSGFVCERACVCFLIRCNGFYRFRNDFWPGFLGAFSKFYDLWLIGVGGRNCFEFESPYWVLLCEWLLNRFWLWFWFCSSSIAVAVLFDDVKIIQCLSLFSSKKNFCASFHGVSVLLFDCGQRLR